MNSANRPPAEAPLWANLAGNQFGVGEGHLPDGPCGDMPTGWRPGDPVVRSVDGAVRDIEDAPVHIAHLQVPAVYDRVEKHFGGRPVSARFSPTRPCRRHFVPIPTGCAPLQKDAHMERKRWSCVIVISRGVASVSTAVASRRHLQGSMAWWSLFWLSLAFWGPSPGVPCP